MFPTRRETRDADAGRQRFPARFEKTGLFGAGDQVAEHFGDFALQRAGMAEDDAAVELVTDGFIDRRIAVAERNRTEPVAVINVAFSVRVPDTAAVAPDDHLRFLRQQSWCLGTGAGSPGHDPV